MAQIVYTIYKGDSLTVIYHPETKIIQHTFQGPASSSELRAALNAGTNLLRRYQVTKWLSDERENSYLSPEDVHYLVTDWAPRTVRAGWKYWAIVVPRQLESRVDAMTIVQACYDLGVRTMVFSDVPEALDWLASL